MTTTRVAQVGDELEWPEPDGQIPSHARIAKLTESEVYVYLNHNDWWQCFPRSRGPWKLWGKATVQVR